MVRRPAGRFVHSVHEHEQAGAVLLEIGFLRTWIAQGLEGHLHRATRTGVTPDGTLQAMQHSVIQVACMHGSPPPPELSSQRRHTEFAVIRILLVGPGQKRGGDQPQGRFE